MSLKMECQSTWSVTQNGMSLKMECHLTWNVTQNGIYSKWYVTYNVISYINPILDTRIFFLLRYAQATPPLDVEVGWSGQLWSNRILLIL